MAIEDLDARFNSCYSWKDGNLSSIRIVDMIMINSADGLGALYCTATLS